MKDYSFQHVPQGRENNIIIFFSNEDGSLERR
jgi:hypothetical protein